MLGTSLRPPTQRVRIFSFIIRTPGSVLIAPQRPPGEFGIQRASNIRMLTQIKERLLPVSRYIPYDFYIGKAYHYSKTIYHPECFVRLAGRLSRTPIPQVRSPALWPFLCQRHAATCLYISQPQVCKPARGPFFLTGYPFRLPIYYQSSCSSTSGPNYYLLIIAFSLLMERGIT